MIENFDEMISPISSTSVITLSKYTTASSPKSHRSCFLCIPPDFFNPLSTFPRRRSRLSIQKACMVGVVDGILTAGAAED